MARSRGDFLFKMLILAGFVWLLIIIMVNLPGSQLDFSRELERAVSSSGIFDASLHKKGESGSLPPVIERLDQDRLRFEEARRRDAAVQLRWKEQEHKEKLIKEDIDRRRAKDRVPPPFNAVHSSSKQSTELLLSSITSNASSGINKGSNVDDLIQSGLIIPRWGDHIEYPLDPRSPGEFGSDVTINKDLLPVWERKKFDEGWQKNAFNQYASDKISVHRTLQDVRDNECKSIKYLDNLPDTSVIIIFHNEAWSTLLRTVHSVLDRSPPDLLREVILVDDFSDLEHLHKPLEDYVAKLRKVHIIRAKSRQGLIRARLLGAARAAGQVLTFLDSHCECARGWLEPLLGRIAENKSNVVTPIIDVVDDSTLRYQYSNARTTNVGGFDWNLQFNWHSIPAREMERRKSPVEPVRSPTMAGGLFSIDKSYFEYLGTYDPGMDIWGGENLELSFRVWMCGGTLEIVLCSHVGHIFRSRSPYAWGNAGNVLKKNSVRLAEVWMDEERKYYYDRLGNDLGDYGDVSARKELRKKLNCKSFKWYLTNIYPEMFVPGDSLASGEIRNKALGRFNAEQHPICLDSVADRNALGKPLALWPCHNMGGNQYWMLSKHGEIRRDDACFDSDSRAIMIQSCHGGKGNQEWEYTEDNTLLHVNSKRCLTLSADGTRIEMQTCSKSDHQVWLWKRRMPSS